jgi:hypothetical protein
MPDDDVMFQVTVAVPASKLGLLLAKLPPKLNPQIARLVERTGPTTGKTWKKQKNADGSYAPAKGTSSDALLKLLKRSQALTRADMVKRLPNEKRPALMSALDRFVKFKVVKNNGDGTYEAL